MDVPDKSKDLFFIGILTSAEVTEKIRSLQHVLAHEFGSSRQLKIPVHITLIPPFRENGEGVTQIKKVLSSFSIERKAFAVKTKGFNTFDDRVFFVDIQLDTELLQLFKDLNRKLLEEIGFVSGYKRSVFKPHVTLANRDLSAENCQKARQYFKDFSFEEQFRCSSVVLFRHVDGYWKIEAEYGFTRGY